MNCEEDIVNKVKKLHELAKDFSLSHAVLATANMIECDKKSSSDNSDEEFLKKYEDNLQRSKQKTIKSMIDERIEQRRNEISSGKVYISVGNLSSKSTAEGARTYTYIRRAFSEINSKDLSLSEHFEILLPPKMDNYPEYDEEGRPLKGSRRFLVGHELGHLWLHLDEVRKNINNLQGTKLLPPELEEEANSFSFELSEFRDSRLLSIADKIRSKKKPKE